MNIKVVTLTDKGIEDNCGSDIFKIFVDEELALEAYENGEPEDNLFCRDLNFIHGIIPLIEEAHAAGKRGEELIINKYQVSESYER